MNEKILKRIGQLSTLILCSQSKEEEKVLNQEFKNCFLDYFLAVHNNQTTNLNQNTSNKAIDTAARKCSVPGCNGKYRAKGYCQKHYAQIRNHGKLTPESEHKKNTKM